MKKMTKADKVFITIAVLFAVWGAYFVYTPKATDLLIP